MDLAFGNAVAPLQGEPGCDRGQVLLQSPREAGQLVDAAVSGFCHPRLEVMASVLPRDGQKGLDQLVSPCNTRVYLANCIRFLFTPVRSEADLMGSS
jgi:hypothetical protein